MPSLLHSRKSVFMVAGAADARIVVALLFVSMVGSEFNASNAGGLLSALTSGSAACVRSVAVGRFVSMARDVPDVLHA